MPSTVEPDPVNTGVGTDVSLCASVLQPTEGKKMANKVHSWRVVDIVTAAVLGVACGVIFVIWNQVGYAGFTAFDVLTPGLGGLAAGIWYLGGPLGLMIIRKPGAAIFVELTASVVSMAIGSQWGISTVVSGLAQGLGAEIVFLLFAYRTFNVVTASLSGVGAAAGAVILELFYGNTPNIARSVIYNITYGTCCLISGLVLAGLLSWLLTRALAQTGVLDRFASGRQYRERV